MSELPFFGKTPDPLRPLTPHQLHIAKAAIENPGATSAEIAKAAGLKDPVKSAAHVDRILAKPQVRAMMISALDEAGATIEKTARVVSEAMDAEEVKIFHSEAHGIVESDPHTDHQTRLRAAELSMKARGVMDEKPQVQVNVVTTLTDEQLAQIAAGTAHPAQFVQQGPAA